MVASGIDLVLLFAGEFSDDGYQLTRPSYRLRLARAIVDSYEPSTFPRLLAIVFGTLPEAECDPSAVAMLQDGFDNWSAAKKRKECADEQT